MDAGAPKEGGEVLRRTLAEPPPPEERIAVLRELAAADANAGRQSAFDWLDEALALTSDPRNRAEIAHEVALSYAALFRWVEAVDVTDRALAELGDRDPALAARLEAELVVAGMHDARRASRVGPVIDRLTARIPSHDTAEPLAVARGMASLLTSQPSAEVADALDDALRGAEPAARNWDTRAALLWTLIIAERFQPVEAALPAMIEAATRGGSARGLIAVYSSLGFLKLRLGALPEADGAARVALRVLQEGDFTAGLGVAGIVAEVAVEAGELDEAQALLELVPEGPAGVLSVLAPAARGRLSLARGDGRPALGCFESCLAMFGSDLWGIQIRDVGYLHARSGAAQAWLLLGDRDRARALAESELADARSSGGRRALGIALRVAGLAQGGTEGLPRLTESVDVLRESPALLERAKSLAELGAALRRAGSRVAARALLAEALDLAADCGARPLAARARAELTAAGGRPRRERRHGLDALTPSELRVARLAAGGQTNRQIAHGLYVTLKTVETHLAHVYAKLGISHRGELPGALAGENLGVPTPTRTAGG
jgi:DNA-binding CsgD family transcriptional regulator